MLIRRLSGLLFVVLAVPGFAFVAAPAQAAACPGKAGVTVIVQSPQGTRTGCAAGDPDTGIQALTRAGFSWAAAGGNGGGAVCRINDYPSASKESCTSMPPRTAYWAYFHAERGGSWKYSSLGAGSYDPAPGSVEGWRFGSGSTPSTRPPAAVEPEPQPEPEPEPAPAPKAVAPSAGTPTAVPSTAVPTPSAKPTKAPGHEAATKAPPPATASTSPRAVPAPATSTPVSEGSEQRQGGVSWLWGLGLLVVLGATGGVVALRRRS